MASEFSNLLQVKIKKILETMQLIAKDLLKYRITQGLASDLFYLGFSYVFNKLTLGCWLPSYTICDTRSSS